MSKPGLSSPSWIRLFFLIVFAVSLSAAPAAAADVRFASGRNALKIPFRLYSNHVYVHVSVNGSAPLWLLLDTGAGNILDDRHARALGLKLDSPGRTIGSGEGEVDYAYARDVSYALPGVTVTKQKFAVVKLSDVEQCANSVEVDRQGEIRRRPQPLTGDQRQPLDGVLGAEFFKLFVVEIDYGTQSISLYHPGSYKYDGQGEVIPLEIAGHIFARGSLKSSKSGVMPGRFLIDTGAMTSLMLNRPFVEKSGLMPPADQTRPFELCGIGGGSPSRIGTLESLRLGSIEVKNPIAVFSEARAGSLASEDYDGMIGNAMLRHFKVVFDYSRKRMILEAP